MIVFKDYSIYYDLLYKDKDYLAEATFINNLIKLYAPEAKSILNLGCGTGSHDFFLADMGYQVTGIDMSADMISIANKKLMNCQNDNVSFHVGDIRSIRLNRQYDVIISLFHVISYQVSNMDLAATFDTVDEHLLNGGIFIFDCWYGPGVLSNPPITRYKVLENDRLKIHRIAYPIMHLDENYVDVNYTILVQNNEDQTFYEINETHKMRYLFTPEVNALCASKKFRIEQLHNNIFSNDWKKLFIISK